MTAKAFVALVATLGLISAAFAADLQTTDTTSGRAEASAGSSRTSSEPAGPAPRLSADGTHVVDANDGGRPLFFNGDTAWSLIAQLSREDAELYLADRRRKGFNLVLVNLIERRFASNVPANHYRDQPFAVRGDFGTPNEAYFAHADWVIRNAASKGIVVLLSPLYLGCCDQGWIKEVQASSPSTMRKYGRYLGERYKDFPNIVWEIGGDADPAPVAGKVREFVAGLRDHDATHLMTAHNSRKQAAVDPWPSEPWLTLNNIYTAGPDPEAALRQYARVPFKPFFLIEARYENESPGGSVQRGQAYATVLSGGTAGHVFGNCPIWSFGTARDFCKVGSWKAELDSEGSRTLALVGRLFASRNFHRLVPDPSRAVAAASGANPPAIVARASDGSTIIAYLPGGGDLTVDMTRVGGTSANAWWFDPRTGAATAAGSGVSTTGRRTFSAPGAGDWVLVLDDASLNLAPPGGASIASPRGARLLPLEEPRHPTPDLGGGRR
jgi:hypothetical protein